MNLFEQIAEIKHDLSSQLTPEQQVKIELLVTSMNKAKSDAKKMEGFIQSIELPAQESELKSATADYLSSWGVQVKTDLRIHLEQKCKAATRYINSKFNLDISWPEKRSSEVDTLEKFLEIYFEEGSIKDLKSSGIEKVKHDFLRHMGGWRVPKLSSKTVTLASFVHYEYWNSGAEISYHYDSNAIDLVAAINLFEFKEPQNHWFFHSLPFSTDRTRKVSFDKYEFNSERVSSVQFYKNGNVKIGFPTKELAGEFFRYFRLDTIKPREW